jgi:hypothetical protein
VPIHSDRRFRFDAARPAVWQALGQVDRYQQWWPWLRSFDADGFAEGETWRCVVKPPLPYSVAFSITLISVVDQESATARLSGDIVGTAEITVSDDREGCVLRLVSDLTAIGGPARLVDRFVPLVASAGHHWVLDQGIRQFRDNAFGG